jgi:hypothetical protein
VDEVARAMIHAGIEAQFFHHEAALVRSARDADRAASLDLGDLPDHRADRARCRGDCNGLARLRSAYLQEARIGRHARHTEDAQRSRDRCRRGIEFA